MNKLTAIIPTFLEADFIEEAIRSVDFADEVIVIDSYSDDGTPDLAKNMGAKVIQRRFDDFSSQKNYALDQASHDWILFIDADERIGEDLQDEIKTVLMDPGNTVAYFMYRNFFFTKKAIRYGGWQSDKVIRLFDRSCCRYDGSLVHEKPLFNGQPGFFKNKLDHYSYRSFDHYASKLNLYASLQAQEMFSKGRKTNFISLFVKPGFRFFVHYFLRLGFLDGIPGFILAAQNGHAVWSRAAKLWMLNYDKKKHGR